MKLPPWSREYLQWFRYTVRWRRLPLVYAGLWAAIAWDPAHSWMRAAFDALFVMFLVVAFGLVVAAVRQIWAIDRQEATGD